MKMWRGSFRLHSVSSKQSMHIQIAIRIVGILLMMFSITMIPPVFVSLAYHDGVTGIFAKAFIVTFVVGFFLWLLFFRQQARAFRS